MALAAVCFVGKQNQPLFLKVLNDEDELSVQTAVFCALDIAEEKLAEQMRDPSVTCGDTFLGYLSPALYFGSKLTDYRICGYASSTNTKIFCLFEDRDCQDDSVCTAEQLHLFRHLHRLFVDTVCNPFLLDSIESPKFLKKLGVVADQYQKSVDEEAAPATKKPA